jgi:lysophospholipase L1-like esterase
VALLVTPMQKVSAAGQTIEVGVASPSLSFSGPAELDLFGQKIETSTVFNGPVRPRLQLTHITLSQQLADFVGSGESSLEHFQDALVRGFWHYFVWEVVVVAVVAVALFGAFSGWRRLGRRSTVVLVVTGVLAAEAVNIGAIMSTAFTAPHQLGEVHSLQQLVGGAQTLPAPTPQSTPTPSGTPTGTAAAAPSAYGPIVVVGDSTAAGLGNPLLPNATADESACRRSIDSYARDLAQASGATVTSYACSSASIPSGLLGPETTRGRTLPAQLDQPAVAKASTIIVSVGANDLEWTDLLEACAVSVNCDNEAEQAYFQQHLAAFTTSYAQLLSYLEQLPNHPRVLVNLYYNPFSSDASCLSSVHLTSSKLQSMLARLATMNSVLSHGAKVAGFATALPDFSDHGLCSATPYVQGLKSAGPFHPTAAGELAIALADEHALASH